MKSQCRGVAAQICLRLADAAQWELIDAAGYEDKLREDIFSAEAECTVSVSCKVAVNKDFPYEKLRTADM